MPPVLLEGPYRPPACQVGSWLDDEIDGRVLVGGLTDAPIPWPRRKKGGRHSLILCGDLIKAIHIESSESVQYWWGVGATTVAKWRKMLGVSQVNPGSLKLRLERHPGVPPADAARSRAKAATPQARSKMADAKRGKPMHANTRTALLLSPSAGCVKYKP